MALFHRATITPTKAELIADWASTQVWGPPAGVAMTGQGEALGMAVYEGRWHIAPSNVRIQGGGWTQDRVPVDRFGIESDDEVSVVFQNDRFELTVFRRPVSRPRPAIGLTATWDGQQDAVVLAEVRER